MIIHREGHAVFTAAEMHIITCALECAAETYLKDRNAASIGGEQRLVDQFHRQAGDAHQLAMLIQSHGF